MADGGRIEIGLVLQGGGALGAYEWGAITALLDVMDAAEREWGHTVTLTGVTGVSIGAVNAACLVGSTDRDDARARLRTLWEDLRLDASPLLPVQTQRDLSLFGLPGFFTPRTDYWNALGWTYVYDTRPLLDTLAEHVDFDRLNGSPTALTVTAVEVRTGRLTRFRNPVAGAYAAEPPPVPRIRPEHVLASGSLAPQFPWVRIGHAHYWDGGLVDNAPLADAIDSFSPGDGVERLLVVLNLYPLRARLPRNLPEVTDRVHELSFGNRLRQDARTAERVNQLVSTIEELAALVPAGELPEALRLQVERARLLKVVTVVDVDMQNPLGSTASSVEQVPVDDSEGLRDFSARTVELRRSIGYRITAERLAAFLQRGPKPVR
jgi:predicted acylesterase/phospholipase RssA